MSKNWPRSRPGYSTAPQRLVKPGGRLIYATCSLLNEEDETQIEHFLAGHADFTLKPIGEVWRETIGGESPHPRRHAAPDPGARRHRRILRRGDGAQGCCAQARASRMMRPPMTAPSSDKVLILDFGSQVTQLIARRVRESGVYCEIHPFAMDESRGSRPSAPRR